MKTIACGILLAALAGAAHAGPDDDMEILPGSLPIMGGSLTPSSGGGTCNE